MSPLGRDRIRQNRHFRSKQNVTNVTPKRYFETVTFVSHSHQNTANLRANETNETPIGHV